MKKLVIILMSIFMLFSFYWAYGRTSLVDGIVDKIKQQESAGYVIDHKGLSAGGYPLKLRAKLQDLAVNSPRQDARPWSFRSDRFTLQAASLNPLLWDIHHSGDARIDMRSSKGARWLFDVRPFNLDAQVKSSLGGKISALSASIRRPQVQAVIGTLPPFVGAERAEIKLRPAGADMQINADIEKLFLSQTSAEKLQKVFGPSIESLRVDMRAYGLSDLGAETIAQWREGGKITGNSWTLDWGGTSFSGDFTLVLAANGMNGNIRAELEDISRLISQLEQAGIFSASQARTAKLAAGLLPVNPAGRQELTLNIRGGYITLFGQSLYKL